MHKPRCFYKNLHKRSGRKASGLYIVEGRKFVDEIPQHMHVERFVMSKAFAESHDCGKFHARAACDILPQGLFDSVVDTVNSQGIFAIVEMPVWGLDNMLSLDAFIVLLEGVSDPGNVGGLIRTAAAAGASGVLVQGACPFGAKAVRAAAGALFRMPVLGDVDVQDTISAIASAGVSTYAAMPQAEVTIFAHKFSRPLCVVIGSEAHGVSCETSARARHISIPMHSGESLNAAAAGSIVLYEVMRQRLAGL